MKTLFLLDRNIIIDIRNHLGSNKLKEDYLANLNKIDVLDNFISPILALIEGDSAREQDWTELNSCIEKDFNYLTNFFKKAKLDKLFFEKNRLETVIAFSDKKQVSRMWPNYIEIIKFIQKELYQPLNKKNAENFKNCLFKLATEYKVPPAHPIIICGLSVLYGNQSARDIMQPKKNISEDEIEKKAYNTLSDIMMIVIALQLIPLTNVTYQNTIFLTKDDGLATFTNQILNYPLAAYILKYDEDKHNVNYNNQTPNGRSFNTGIVNVALIKIEAKKELFPNLSQIEYDELIRDLHLRNDLYTHPCI